MTVLPPDSRLVVDPEIDVGMHRGISDEEESTCGREALLPSPRTAERYILLSQAATVRGSNRKQLPAILKLCLALHKGISVRFQFHRSTALSQDLIATSFGTKPPRLADRT